MAHLSGALTLEWQTFVLKICSSVGPSNCTVLWYRGFWSFRDTVVFKIPFYSGFCSILGSAEFWVVLYSGFCNILGCVVLWVVLAPVTLSSGGRATLAPLWPTRQHLTSQNYLPSTTLEFKTKSIDMLKCRPQPHLHVQDLVLLTFSSFGFLHFCDHCVLDCDTFVTIPLTSPTMYSSSSLMLAKFWGWG